MKPVFADSAGISTREHLVLKGGSWGKVTLQVRFGLLRHPEHGPILIDTGYTPHAVSAPGRSLALRIYGAMLSPQIIAEEQPEALLEYYGFAPADVAFVIVTHFHADHVSGLSLFPNARFIADDAAWSRTRVLSEYKCLRHGVFKELFPPDFEHRLEGISGKPRVQLTSPEVTGVDLLGDGSLIGIALPGHADGHFGVLFTETDPMLLYAVDTEWMRRALIEDRSPGFPASLVAYDGSAAGETSCHVRALIQQGVEVMLCHDPAKTPFDFRAEKETS